jgi:hypothetical protein
MWSCPDSKMQEMSQCKNDNNSFEGLRKFKYLGTNLKCQNSIQEENKSRLNSGNVCYHLVQNILSSSLLSKNIKIKIYRSIILSVILCGFVHIEGGT